MLPNNGIVRIESIIDVEDPWTRPYFLLPMFLKKETLRPRSIRKEKAPHSPSFHLLALFFFFPFLSFSPHLLPSTSHGNDNDLPADTALHLPRGQVCTRSTTLKHHSAPFLDWTASPSRPSSSGTTSLKSSRVLSMSSARVLASVPFLVNDQFEEYVFAYCILFC